jgi:hypothetical protein
VGAKRVKSKRSERRLKRGNGCKEGEGDKEGKGGRNWVRIRFLAIYGSVSGIKSDH